MKKEMNMKNAVKIAGLGLLAMMTAACNTVAGAGQDIEAGGEAIEDAANDVEEDIKD